MASFWRALLFALVVFAMPGSPASALEVRTEDEVTVPAGTTIDDDLVVVGTLVRIDGRVTGDVYVVAPYVIVGGQIDGDLFAAGQQVTVAGTIVGSVRAVGGRLLLDGPVGRGVLAGVDTVQSTPRGRVGTSLTFATRRLLFDGSISRGLTGLAGDATVGGAVGGAVRLAADRLRFAPSASVVGPLDYWSDADAEIAPGARLGRLTRHQPETRDVQQEVRAALELAGRVLTLLWLAGTLVASALVFGLRPDAARAAGDRLAERPIRTLLQGLALLVGGPLLCLLLVATAIGLPLAALGAVGWLLGLGLAPVAVAGGLGALATRRLGWRRPAALSAPTALLGLWLGAALPNVGWIVSLATASAGLGLLFAAVRWALRRPSGEPAGPAAVPIVEVHVGTETIVPPIATVGEAAHPD